MNAGRGSGRCCAGLLALLMFGLLSSPAKAEVIFEDAQRFEVLFRNTGQRPSESELQAHYLDLASPGLEEFAQHRIGDAQALFEAVREQRGAYFKAVRVCLNAAKRIRGRLPRLQRKVAAFLGYEDIPPVTFLIGAGQSGGTVGETGVLVALEVVCWFAGDGVDARNLLEEFVIHETVHYYQLAVQSGDGKDSLLRQALLEGVADFVTSEVLGRVGISESARHQFGLFNEAALWEEFQQDMGGRDLKHWMYGLGRDGEPADLGYWMGKRIADHYWRTAEDPEAALRALLLLESPEQLLEQSGYAPAPAP